MRIKKSRDRIITNGVIKNSGIFLIDGSEPDYYEGNYKEKEPKTDEEKKIREKQK